MSSRDKLVYAVLGIMVALLGGLLSFLAANIYNRVATAEIVNREVLIWKESIEKRMAEDHGLLYAIETARQQRADQFNKIAALEQQQIQLSKDLSMLMQQYAERYTMMQGQLTRMLDDMAKLEASHQRLNARIDPLIQGAPSPRTLSPRR